MKATLVSLFALMYGVVYLEGGPLDLKDGWSDLISVDESKRILRDGKHGVLDQVEKDKEDSGFVIQRRHSVTPGHSQGVVTDKSDTVPKILADQSCGLQETVVKLDQPVSSWYSPSAIKLFRCMGSSGFVSPHVQHCVVTRQQQLKLQVLEFFSGSYAVKTINVMNHTACDTDCIVQASDCNPKFESFNKQTCRCDCVNNDVSVCSPKFQVWDQSSCGCRCKYPATNCPTGQEWSADPNVCGCVAKTPDITCPAGESLDMNTCTCEASVTT